jgi:phenylpropionate dioxygenase-like ring-hydroxylating dioxygenase large terminal subunit
VEPEPRLVPVGLSKGQTSVARVVDDWYVVCRAKDLGRRPRPATLLGVPLVVFRGADGRPGALIDRCAHRNVPLSIGRVVGDRLECGYHGWQFDREGVCRVVPALVGKSVAKGRAVDAYPCREQDGLVWVYGTPGVEPAREPYTFPLVGERGYTTVIERVEAQATLHATAENALDVPHTAFLHRGLFREDGDRNDIEVVVTRHHDRVEAQYVGEPRPTGLVGWLLAPRGGVVTHYDRFLLPSIAQVEYRLDRAHILVSAALTPVSDFHTELYAVISFRLPLPGWLVAPFLRPIAMRIFRQDAAVLKLQTDAIHRFGGEQYVSTEIDVLGGHILRLLRNAERGDRTPLVEPAQKRLTMRV